MGMMEVALAPNMMGCGNVGGGTGTWQDGVQECWKWHWRWQDGVWERWRWRWHLAGWCVGMLEVAPASGRIGCGNVGGGAGIWQDGVWER